MILNNSNSPLPLAGIRVLEFSHAVLGPACGMILADLGAEVIKIEPAPEGESTRRLKGFGMGYFPYFNRNKKSLAINIKSEAGQEIVFQLLETSDVLIENFGPGTMDRLGYGYQALGNRFPNLVYCALKGFHPGPYENRMALDEVVQMMSGLAYMTGPSGQPLRAGASVIDIMTGVYGAMGILLALQERKDTGKGQLVQSALFETAAYIMGHHMTYSAVSGEQVPPMPERVSAWAIYHQFEVADGRVFIGVTSDKQWMRFCEVFERGDLLEDPRYMTNNDRIEHSQDLLPDLRDMLKRYSVEKSLDLCSQANLPFSPIARPEDLFDDPQLLAGDSLMSTTLPDGTQTALPRLPFRLEHHSLDILQDPPQIGEHSEQILTELGYSESQIQAMENDEIISIYQEKVNE